MRPMSETYGLRFIFDRSCGRDTAFRREFIKAVCKAVTNSSKSLPYMHAPNRPDFGYFIAIHLKKFPKHEILEAVQDFSSKVTVDLLKKPYTYSNSPKDFPKHYLTLRVSLN